MTQTHIGRYEIKKELGRGGMATVYLAYDPQFKRDVAIKVLPREFLHNPTFHSRFEREAETVATLEHPAIVPVYDVGEDDGQPFLVMRYMAGGSLADRLKEGGLPLEEVSRIYSRLSPGLDEAHSLGIVHRDLKPDNILFDSRNEPYLADFGIVKLSEGTSAVTGSMIIGTPAFMSPEQANGSHQIDGRSDIYALGVILFFLLTGEEPYKADTPIQQAIKHITEPIPKILEVKPDLPAGLAPIIEKAMAKDPAGRYPTATQLAQHLASVAQSSGDVYHPTEAIPGLSATDIFGKAIITDNRKQKTETTQQASFPRWVWGLGAGVIVLILFFIIQGANPPPPPSPTPSSTSFVRVTTTATRTPIVVTRNPATATNVPVVVQPSRGEPVIQVLGNLNGHGGFVESVAWSNDNRLASSDRSGSIKLWDGATRQEINFLFGHEGAINSVAWSPDNTMLASASEDGTVRLWDTDTGDEIAQLTANDEVNAVVWSPDGSLLASGGADGLVQIWDVATEQEIGVLTGHTDPILSLSWSPDGVTLASSSNDETIRVWDTDTEQQVRLLIGHTGPITAVAFSSDGSLIASGSADSSARIWDVASGSQVRLLEGHTRAINGIAWSPDDGLLATAAGDETVRIWDVFSGVEFRALEGHNTPVFAIAWSVDGSQIASAGRDGRIILWGISQ